LKTCAHACAACISVPVTAPTATAKRFFCRGLFAACAGRLVSPDGCRCALPGARAPWKRQD
jgi:hypothetical protein